MDHGWYVATVIHPNERIGAPVTWSEIRDFQHCDVCGIKDMKAVGSYFTWNNKQERASRVFCKIDRALINTEWMDTWEDSVAHFLPEGLYDHCPCIIRLRQQVEPSNISTCGHLPLISNHWAQQVTGTAMFQLVTRLKKLKRGLKGLNRSAVGNIETNTVVAYEALITVQKQLQEQPSDVMLGLLEKQLASDYRQLLKARYLYLAQKAKVHCLKEGDDNTPYFHSTLKQTRAQNKVMVIKDMNGVVKDKPRDVNKAFIEFYEALLGSSKAVEMVHIPTVRAGKLVEERHIDILLQPVTGEEIRRTMFEIPGNKASGPDRYSSQFFKDSWNVVRRSVIEAIQDVFNTGQLLTQMNATILTLIPKKDVPSSVTEFRPIACCNTIYKCIAKLICNRLGEVLPDIISPNQSAFAKGRDIVENILICQDIVKLYKRKTCSPRVMMKIDLQKAYDTVEWQFVENVLISLCFPPRLIQLIMTCVSTPSYTLALNGDTFGFFKGKRGLRQGDPLSPLLFTLCMEYLSRILQRVQEMLHFQFHSLCKSIKLNHLCFADDLLLFCRGDECSVRILLRGFATFSNATGLQMNSNESNIYMNGVDEDVANGM